MACPLKRSGGITPLIPLWENKSKGRPVCARVCAKESESPRGSDVISVWRKCVWKRKIINSILQSGTWWRKSEREIERSLCVCALLNQACNASFYWKASPDSCDKWQASLIWTWKSESKKGRERKGGVERKWEKKRIQCRNERVGDQCGLSKENEIVPLLGELRVLFSWWQRWEEKGRKWKDDQGHFLCLLNHLSRTRKLPSSAKIRTF